MGTKAIGVLIGLIISGVLLYPLFKKYRAEEKAQAEELMKKVDDMAKEALDEELRHMQAMEDIERKGEQELKELREKEEEETKKLIEKIEQILWMHNANGTATNYIPYKMIMKYKDAKGVIHKFDAASAEQLRKVMEDKTNRLIFN